MNGNTDLLRDIVLVAGDGAEFYEHAAQHIPYVDLREIFARMAATKRELIGTLSARMRELGEQPPSTVTLLGALRRSYTDLRARLATDDAEVYVAQLAEVEHNLLRHIEEAIHKTNDPNIRMQLEAHMPKVRACRDEMKRLKQQLTATTA